MGYRSEVKIVTTIEGFNEMKNYVDKYLHVESNATNNTSEMPYNLLDNLDEKVLDEENNYVLFGWNYIKWYDMYYKDVIAVCKALKHLEEKNIPYQFVRIGEDPTDIEDRYSEGYFDTDMPSILVQSYIELCL